jgi:HK97 family phage portal protein
MASWMTRAGAFLRGAAERKNSRAHALFSLHSTGQPVWSPRNYQVFAKQGFGENPIGYRCVKMIAEAAASVPWQLRQRGEIVSQNPLLDLLTSPNPVESGNSLMESFYSHLQIAGNAYLEAAVLAGDVRELHVLRPDRMKVVAGSDGWPQAYEYSVNGASVRFDQTEQPLAPILHVKMFNPADDHYGMSPFEAAARAIDIHNAAGAWNKALLDNAARPSGALVYAGHHGDDNLTNEQFERLKSELATTYQGSANAGRPMVLEGGLDWKPLSLSPKDMEHIEAKHVAAREIALAFGVPPMLLAIPGDNTFANYAEANRSFWRQTVLPLVSRTAQDFSNWLAPVFGEDLQLGFDADNITALASERQARWSMIAGAEFLTAAEKRQMLGLSE